MEPISATASIVGLIGAAAEITRCLTKFTSSVKGAPKLAQTVLVEVSGIRTCLDQLERYLVGSKARPRSHDDLVMIEPMVVALTNCVTVFSELEEAFDFLKPGSPMNVSRVAQWPFKEQTIQELLTRLSISKTSISLMLAQ